MKPVLAFLGALLLAACAAQPGTAPVPVTPASVAQQVILVDAALKAAIPGLVAGGIAVPPAASVALSDLNAAADALKGTDSPSAAQATRIVGDINAVVGAIGSLPGLPPKVSTVIMAAEVVVPVIEAAFGLSGAPATPIDTNGLSQAEAWRILWGSGAPVVAVPLTK